MEVQKKVNKYYSAFDRKTILMYGNMGVGKTTFIKSFVKALKSDDDVTSPTFSIVNEYVTPSDKVFHFDLTNLQYSVLTNIQNHNQAVLERSFGLACILNGFQFSMLQ